MWSCLVGLRATGLFGFSIGVTVEARNPMHQRRRYVVRMDAPTGFGQMGEDNDLVPMCAALCT